MAELDSGALSAQAGQNTASFWQMAAEIEAVWKRIRQNAVQASSAVGGSMAEGLRRYQSELERVGEMLEKQRGLVQQLQSAQAGVAPAETSDSAPAAARLEEEQQKLRELEGQFDSTRSAMASFVSQQGRAADQAAEAGKKMDLRPAGETVRAGASLAASGLRLLEQAIPGLSGNISQLTGSFGSLIESIAGFAAGSVSLPGMILNVAGAALTLVNMGIEAVKKAEEERQKSFEEGVQKNREYTDSLNALEGGLRILTDETSAVEALRSARQELADTFPELVAGYDGEGNAILVNNERIEEQIQSLRARQELSRQQIVESGGGQDFSGLSDLAEKIQKTEELIEHYRKASSDPLVAPDQLVHFSSALEKNREYLEELNAEYESKKYGASEYYEARLQGALRLADENGNLTGTWQDMNEAQRRAFSEFALTSDNLDRFISGEETAEEAAARLMRTLNDPAALKEYAFQLETIADRAEKLAQSGDAYLQALSGLNAGYQALSEGQALSVDQLYELAGAYPEVAAYLAQTGDLTLKNGEILQEVADQRRRDHEEFLQQNLDALESERNKAVEMLPIIEAQLKANQALAEVRSMAVAGTDTEYLEKERARLQAIIEQYDETRAKLTAMKAEPDGVNPSGAKSSSARNSALSAELKRMEQRKKMNQLTYEEELEQLQRIQSRYKLNEDEKMDLEYRIYSVQQSLESAREQAVLESYTAELDAMEKKRRMGELTYEEEIERLQKLKELKGLQSEQQEDLDYKIHTAQKNMEDEAVRSATNRLNAEYRSIEHKKRMDELSSKEELEWLCRIQDTFRMRAEEKMDLQERIHELQKRIEEEEEQAATDRLNAEYQAIEQKKQLGRLSGEEELAWLRRIQDTFKMNKDEQMELEIKLYNLKRELHSQDAEALNSLGGAVTEALKKQYEAQQKAEEERINASIEGWKKWEEDTVSAIQGQIDALDELEKEQENADRRAEYERKKQALTLQLAYEKDDYQRKQYQLELTRLEKEEQKRLDAEARAAEKKRLEEQIEAAKNAAAAQEDLLKQELDAVKEKYADLTSEFKLRAEAEKAIMNSAQQEIVSLIQSFAPEYDLAGQSLGEKLAEGFREKFGSVLAYVEAVTNQIQDYQNMLIKEANAAADRFWAAGRADSAHPAAPDGTPKVQNTEINMPIQFNQPVSSPVETRRAIQQVADELARQIS